MPSDQTPKSRTSDVIEVHETFLSRLRRRIIGAPRDLRDKSMYHALMLTPFLAWVGLGSDALSSSAYGPEEGFRHLGNHGYLVVALALATAVTVTLLSSAYSKLIEHFPNGGGYGVASRLLGPHVGLLSGCALLIDYVLTIAISIAVAGKAIFSFLPEPWRPWILWADLAIVVVLTGLNLRGVRESVLVLMPMFVLFLATHLVLIAMGLILHAPQVGDTVAQCATQLDADLTGMGIVGILGVFLHAYALGGGTYTGIEAVSNALPLMREPRVQNAKRTMMYLAISLAITAGGLLLCYLLWNVQPDANRTLNAVLFDAIAANLPGGHALVVAALVSEATLLLVAAQAGFMGGPRVSANMAVDSWLPHGFSSMSERLTIENGILIMGGASLAVLWFSDAYVPALVLAYAINVFVTFLLTMAAMFRFWWRQPKVPVRWRRLTLYASCFLLCATILAVTVWTAVTDERVRIGGYLLIATPVLYLLCLGVRQHYRVVTRKASALFAQFGELPLSDDPPPPLNPSQPTAIVLVGSYGALGIHTLLNALRVFPGHFANAVFVSVGVMDSGVFKGEDTIDELRLRTEGTLRQYQRLATGLGLPSAYHFAIGTDAVDEAEKLCLKIAKQYPRCVFFAGRLIFQDERWYHRLLHNNTAHAVQKRLHWAGKAMVIMPARMN